MQFNLAIKNYYSIYLDLWKLFSELNLEESKVNAFTCSQLLNKIFAQLPLILPKEQINESKKQLTQYTQKCLNALPDPKRYKLNLNVRFYQPVASDTREESRSASNFLSGFWCQ